MLCFIQNRLMHHICFTKKKYEKENRVFSFFLFLVPIILLSMVQKFAWKAMDVSAFQKNLRASWIIRNQLQY